jgi:iron complex transport system permease protein
MAVTLDSNDAATGLGKYRALTFRRAVLIAGLVAALFLSMSIDMALGPANYALSDVLKALFRSDTVSDQLRVVIWDIRMPIALMAPALAPLLRWLAGSLYFRSQRSSWCPSTPS